MGLGDSPIHFTSDRYCATVCSLATGTIENDITVDPGQGFSFAWQVNGSLVVDHTSMQWGTFPDPITHYTVRHT